MKLSVFALALLCSILYTSEAQYSDPPTMADIINMGMSLSRARRAPQGSVRLHATQPLSGPNRDPSVDLSYNQRIIDNGRTTLDAYGGANLRNQHVSPHAGVNYEHRFKNDIFLSGQGQVREGPRGRMEPSVGAGIGWRFRREAVPPGEEKFVQE